MDAKQWLALSLIFVASCSVAAEPPVEASSLPKLDPAVTPAAHRGKPTPARSLAREPGESLGPKLPELRSAPSPLSTPRLAPPPIARPPRTQRRPLPLLPEVGDAVVVIGDQGPADRAADELPPAPLPMPFPPQPMAERAATKSPLKRPTPKYSRSEVAAAFDVGEITLQEPELEPAATQPAGIEAPLEPTSSGVELAIATQMPEEPAAFDLLMEAEQLARGAHTITELTELIELIGDRPQQPKLAKVAGWALNRRGELRADAGDERGAYDDFDDAIRIDGNCWAALHNRGVTLARYGRQTEALEDFTRALRLNPTFTSGFANRAELLLDMSRTTAAEADFTRALADRPDDVPLLTGRASARAAGGKLEDAVRDLNSAIRLQPKSPELFAQRGALYAETHFYEQAVSDFYAALKLDPHCVPAYQAIAWLLSTCQDRRFRDSAKAVESARRALMFGDANDPLLLATAAAASAASGDQDQAIRYQQQAIVVAEPAQRQEYRQRLARYRRGLPLFQTANASSDAQRR